MITGLAANGEALVIEGKDGMKSVYNLGDNPILTYEGSQMKVKASNAEAQFELMEIERCYFSAEATGTDALQDLSNMTVLASESGLQIKNSQPGSVVNVYTANGKQLATHRTDQAGNLTLDLSKAPSGVLLVKIETTTIKLIKK